MSVGGVGVRGEWGDVRVRSESEGGGGRWMGEWGMR